MITSISNLTQKARETAGTSKAYSNKKDRKKKCSSSQEAPARIRNQKRKNEKGPLYNECKQREKLL